MRILHLCLSCFYIDDVLYQENELVREHVSLGHDVRVIASTETMSEAGQITYTNPGEYLGSDGALVQRLPYRRILPQKIMRKLRMHPGVYSRIGNFSPDVIVFHGACGWELLTVKKYVDRHPNVCLWIDSHEDANNSARSFLSRELLHRRYYGPILRRALGADGRVLCISLETMDFIHQTYGIPVERLDFFPLGGRPLDDRQYEIERAGKRSKLGLSDDHLMFFQSGKFGRLKRLRATLDAFLKTPDPSFRLFLSGVVTEDADEIRRLIASDSRITFLGWSEPSEMVGLLAATDVYLQPGSQSVTMQNSMCQRCAVVIDDVKSHQPFIDGNGFLTKAGTDMAEILQHISSHKPEVEAMKSKSYSIAKRMLNYSTQASQLIEGATHAKDSDSPH